MPSFTVRTLLFLVLLGSGFQCKHDITRGSSGGKLTGKLIISGPCSNYVIQVLKGDIDPAKLEASWKDASLNNFGKDTTYHNVFTVSNMCSFEGAKFPVGTIFTFDLDPNPPVQDCFVCYIFRRVPEVRNAVRNVKKGDNL